MAGSGPAPISDVTAAMIEETVTLVRDIAR